MIRTASIMRPLPTPIDDIRGVTQPGCSLPMIPSKYPMQPLGTGRMQARAGAGTLDPRCF